MRILGIVMTALLLSVYNMQPAMAQATDENREVRDAVMLFARAYRQADVKTLTTMLAPHYVHINGGSGSRIDRERWLQWVASQKKLLESGDLVIDSYDVSDLQFNRYGDSVVVTGTVVSNGVRNGKPYRVNVRFTNLWVKLGENWLRAAFHDSSVPASD